MPVRLALKVDVDTDRGTRVGVPQLVADCRAVGAPAAFLFSLGPDQTGRAITRIFRPGFFQKVSRTSVVQIYGLRTLLNGTLLPAPHIGRRNAETMRAVRAAGFEVGIHCYNHYRWQVYVQTMAIEQVRAEFVAARAEFRRIFGVEAHTAGAPGWQSNARSRQVYDEAGVEPTDIPVVELHDCFTTNELLSYEALGLTPEGTAEKFVLDEDNTYGGRVVTNPSGGLLSKGHPLGATGLAQCAELVWQLRGRAGDRQVDGASLALQHNIGLGGAAVVTLYERSA